MIRARTVRPFAPFAVLAIAAACGSRGPSGGEVPETSGDAGNREGDSGSAAEDGSGSAGGPDGASSGSSSTRASTSGSTSTGGATGSSSRSSTSSANGGADAGTGADAAKPSDAASGGDGCSSGPIGTFAGALAAGITFTDTDGKAVNAHGGGIIQVGNTFYMHGEFFLSTTTNNDFNGFSMYSSTDLATWKNEGIILPQQPSGQLGPARKGERPHIIKCPATGEFVLYAHAASEDYQTDKEVVYATSPTVNGQYSFKGSLTNASGTIAAHSDMSAYADNTGAYVLTESGHVYTLASDCHSWLTDQAFNAVNGNSGGSESPTVFKAGSTYYWIGSYKTGWRANNNFYSTAPAVTGPWTYQGFLAPVTDPTNDISDQRTWLSQSTWVQPVKGCSGTTYVYWGDHWYGTQDTTAPGQHNYLATYVFQPLIFTGTQIGLPTYLASWTLDVGAGSWSQ
jgi:hypothetical protein